MVEVNRQEYDYAGSNDELDEHYYKNRDLKLLLDLLASNFGVMPSLRVLALFDKRFGEKCKPGDLKFLQPNYHENESEINIANEDGVKENIHKTKVFDIDLEFEDAPGMGQIFTLFKSCNCSYTVELLPPTPSFCVKQITVNKYAYDILF